MGSDADDRDANPPAGQIVIYHDGATRLQVRLDGRTVWLTQRLMAELYQTTPQNITLHIKGIYEDGELDEGATCKELLQVQDEIDRDPICDIGEEILATVQDKPGFAQEPGS